MKRKNIAKLQLSKETLSRLEKRELSEAAGGIRPTDPRVDCTRTCINTCFCTG
jgi:hypothetical protein